MRRAALLAGIVLAAAAALALLLFFRRGRPRPDLATLPPVAVLQDFERSVSVRRWPYIVTAYYPDPTQWDADFRRRRT